MICVSYLAMGSKAGDNYLCIGIIVKFISLHVHANHPLCLVDRYCCDLNSFFAGSFGVAYTIEGVGKTDHVLLVVDLAENGLASLWFVQFAYFKGWL